MARVLVIDEEETSRSVLLKHLTHAGHEVRSAATGSEGIRCARELEPDLILLEVMLRDMQGFEVCSILQKSDATRTIPIIIVSARGDEVDRVVGFELGASDYVVKPFSARELVLRVQALLRRVRREPETPTIVVGNMRIDPQAHRVWVEGSEVELTLLEFKLLLALYEHRERVLTRAVLLDGVWGIDVTITTRTVDTHVKRLRDKLAGAGSYIETVRGIGYRFAAAPES